MDAPSKTIAATPGEVLTLHEPDMDYLRESMASPFTPIKQAVLKPNSVFLRGLSDLAPAGVAFPTLLGLSRALAATHPLINLGDDTGASIISEILENVPDLTFADRVTFISAPAPARSPQALDTLEEWARDHAAGREVDLRGWLRSHAPPEVLKGPERLKAQSSAAGRAGEPRESVSSEGLAHLEGLHRCLVLYLWLGHRLPQTFSDMELCQEWKSRLESALMAGLGPSSGSRGHGKRRKASAPIVDGSAMQTAAAAAA